MTDVVTPGTGFGPGSGWMIQRSSVGKETGMLSDSERRRLTEIERGLRSEDPQFVARFGQGMLPDSRRWHGMSTRGWLIAAALTMASAILMASAMMAVFALSVAGMGAGLWLRGHRRFPQDRRPPQ